MASQCVSTCMDDARVPARATYVSLGKWSESGGLKNLRVVDGVSCRQLFLRSYTFSRKETVPERTKKCFGRVRERVAADSGSGGGRRKRSKRRGKGAGGHRGLRRCVVMRRIKKISRVAVRAIFQRLLSCTASVDIVDQRKG